MKGSSMKGKDKPNATSTNAGKVKLSTAKPPRKPNGDAC